MKNLKMLTIIIFFSVLFVRSISASAIIVYSNPKPVPYCVGISFCRGVTILATPSSGKVNTVNPGLTWQATGGPTECHASGDWSGNNKPFVQSTPVPQGVLNTVRTYSYTITCTYPDAPSPLSATAIVVVADYQCRDDIDNADLEDDKIDEADPGCHSDGDPSNAASYVPTDDDETNGSVPSGTLAADDCTINTVGGTSCSSMVNWTTASLTTNPTNITRNPNGPAPFTPSPLAVGQQSVTIPYGTTTFYLNHQAGALATDAATASCGAGLSWATSGSCQSPEVNLSCSPVSAPNTCTVPSGGSALLSWVTSPTGAFTSCTASATPSSPTWTGSKLLNSVYPHDSTGALTVNKVFTLTCTGPAGTESSSKTVLVTNTEPDITGGITAIPNKIAPGESSTLTWWSTGATTCDGINFNTQGATNNDGSNPATVVKVFPTANTTYTLTCVNSDPTKSKIYQAIVSLRKKFLFIEY